MTGVSRRQFLTGAGLAGIGAAGGPYQDALRQAKRPRRERTAPRVPERAPTSLRLQAIRSVRTRLEWSRSARRPQRFRQTRSRAPKTLTCSSSAAASQAPSHRLPPPNTGRTRSRIDKCSTWSGRGGHITAYGSRMVKQYVEEGWFEEADYAHRTSSDRMGDGTRKEPLLWQFARNPGACMDWLEDLVADSGLHPTLWAGYRRARLH